MGDFKQYSKELNKLAKKNFERRTIITYFPNDIWAMDLMDVGNISKDNDGIKFLLNIVDIYSRYAYSIPLKSKKGTEILKAVKTLKVLPKKMWVDEGHEFYNKEFMTFLKSNNIDMYHTNSGLKSVFVERFNRTLREIMNQYFIEHNTDEYVNVLQDMIDDYNNKIHSRTKQKPINIYLHNAEPKQKEITGMDKPKFSIGDFVRISKVKKTFEKGYTIRWSKEVFEITEVDNKQDPVMYRLKDLKGETITGKFYEAEMQLTKLKDFAIIDKILKTKKIKGVKMFYVHYDGYDDKFDEWIDEDKLEAMK